MAKKRKPNPKLQQWSSARKGYHLSHAQVQMARELGMNPIKLGCSGSVGNGERVPSLR
jgi:hypothetical protein